MVLVHAPAPRRLFGEEDSGSSRGLIGITSNVLGTGIINWSGVTNQQQGLV